MFGFGVGCVVVMMFWVWVCFAVGFDCFEFVLVMVWGFVIVLKVCVWVLGGLFGWAVWDVVFGVGCGWVGLSVFCVLGLC